jgi:hypothetical protein
MAAYPKFFREGDMLVKVGWSRTEKTEYEHKCPVRILWSLVRLLEKSHAGGKRFTMNELLPLVDSVDGTEVPMYQAYLCLAWLRSAGIVVQHGRQGYSLAGQGDLVTAAESQWSQLPRR